MSRIDHNRLPKLLTTILKSTDVRSQLLDRPTTSRPVNVLHALIKVIERERPIHEDWFARKKNRGVYKTWMGKINMLGGSTIFETKTVDELEEIFSDLLTDSAQE